MRTRRLTRCWRILRNPLSAEKGEILKSLFAYPKPALLEDILREAADEHSYHRATAIFALGAYSETRVERFLLPLLGHPSSTIRSTAAKSLARVGNAGALPHVRRLVREPDVDLWDRMNYLVAVSVMDQERRYLEHLFDIADHYQSASYAQTMFSLAAKMLGMEPALSDLYQEENLETGAGLRLFLEESKQLEPFFRSEREIFANYAERDYQAVWQWCRELLARHPEDRQWQYLKKAIQDRGLQGTSRESAFAALYFTYQILS